MLITPAVAGRAAKVALPYVTVTCARDIPTTSRQAISVGRLRAGGGAVATLRAAGSIWATGKPWTDKLRVACVVHSGAERAGMDAPVRHILYIHPR